MKSSFCLRSLGAVPGLAEILNRSAAAISPADRPLRRTNRRSPVCDLVTSEITPRHRRAARGGVLQKLPLSATCSSFRLSAMHLRDLFLSPRSVTLYAVVGQAEIRSIIPYRFKAQRMRWCAHSVTAESDASRWLRHYVCTRPSAILFTIKSECGRAGIVPAPLGSVDQILRSIRSGQISVRSDFDRSVRSDFVWLRLRCRRSDRSIRSDLRSVRSDH